MSLTVAFLWGSFGSLATEIVAIMKTYRQYGRLPKRYRSVWFWIARSTLIGIAGGLTVAFGPASPLHAIYIGMATPLILERLITATPDQPWVQASQAPPSTSDQMSPNDRSATTAPDGRSLAGSAARN
jgi:hypothetical protein